MGGMIVAPQPLAVEAGAQVLMHGGNAIDAAVTCAFCQFLLSPHSCGVGGYVILTMRLADGRALGLDAPALAGSKVLEEMWSDRVIRPNPDGWGFFLEEKVNDCGYQSICVPGTVRGMATILDRWGTIPWADALAPAIQLAETGFTVDSHLAAGWQSEPKYPEACSLLEYVKRNDEARRIYLKADGSKYAAGDTLRNPDYARTLRRLASAGAEDFYVGELGARVSRDLQANGSFVTADDLANYALRHTSPVRGTYRGYDIYTSPPPHGGPTLIEILNILEAYDLGGMSHNSPDYIYLLARAMKAAFADRNPHLGDPQFVDVPLEWMTSRRRAEEWNAIIDADRDIQVSFAPPEPPDTTHVSVADDDGNYVALTHSLGSSSGVITPGLGFMYNNSMVNFCPWAGHPNSIAPCKSRTTGMTPTVICKDGRPMMVIGAPGATRIITSVAQVIANVIDFGMPISEAVWAPRIDCQGDLIKAQARIPEYVCAQVHHRHPIVRLPQSHGGLALVHAITLDPDTGEMHGAADTGAGGMALSV